MHGGFLAGLYINPGFSDQYFKQLGGSKRKKIFIWVSATKSFDRSRIFRYGLPKDIMSKWQKKTTAGGGRTGPPPPAS